MALLPEATKGVAAARAAARGRRDQREELGRKAAEPPARSAPGQAEIQLDQAPERAPSASGLQRH